MSLLLLLALGFIGYKAYISQSQASAPSQPGTTGALTGASVVSGEPGPPQFSIHPVAIYGIPVAPYKLIQGADQSASSSGSGGGTSGGIGIIPNSTLKPHVYIS